MTRLVEYSYSGCREAGFDLTLLNDVRPDIDGSLTALERQGSKAVFSVQLVDTGVFTISLKR
jgi:hypothetical protein